MPDEGKASARRREFGKIAAWLLVIAGFFTLLPIDVGKPNFLGSFTLCSFAPVATVTMFIIALTVYWYSKKSDLVALGILFLLIIAVFSGIWAYNAKLPMDGISVNMVIDIYYFGERYPGEGNISKIFLNLTLHNPTLRNAPAFAVEYCDFFVEGKKLEFQTYDIFPSAGIRSIKPVHVELGANQSITLDVEITLHPDLTRVEGDTIESIWGSLARGDFTLRMDAILVSRSYYGPEQIPEYSFVLASKPFSVSSAYQS